MLKQEQHSFRQFFEELKPTTFDWDSVHQNKLTDSEISEDISQYFLLPSSQASNFNEPETLKGTESQPTNGEGKQSLSPQGRSQSSKKKPCDYEKNIVPYVSKKVCQQFIHARFRKIVEKLCKKAKCNYKATLDYYKKRSKEVFGVGHLGLLISPQNQEEVNMKKAFCAFQDWFLRHRYMFYMLKFGKMEDKEVYIEYKNRYFLYLKEANESQKHYY